VVYQFTVSWAFSKSTWKPFTKRFDKYLSDLRSYQENIEKEGALCHMTEAKKARDMQKQESIAKKRQKILGLLSRLDYKSHHRRLQKVRHQGTGSWLAEVPSLRSWLQGQASGCFCCFGIPGSGKTILASTIIDSMSPFFAQVDAAICYYYCDYANTSSLNASIILGTLIRQLLERIQIPSEIAKDIDHYFQEGATEPLLEDLFDFLAKALRPFKRVMVVLDGLDELIISDQKAIIKLVRQLTQPSGTITKVMVFSRREERLIRTAFQGYEFIDISVKLVRNDLARFISDSVDMKLNSHELSIREPGLKQVIIDTLVEGAEDM
jgi:Cdc6-like AAA superfamily ATPase